LQKIAENCRKLQKIAENCRKLQKNCRKFAKIAEVCDRNIDPRHLTFRRWHEEIDLFALGVRPALDDGRPELDVGLHEYFTQILRKFYANFTQILRKFYANFTQILRKFYANFTQILLKT
jgi:hypothetical protein